MTYSKSTLAIHLLMPTARLININQNADPADGDLPGGSWNYFDDTQDRRFSVGARIRF